MPIRRVFVFTQNAIVNWLKLAARVIGFKTRAKSEVLFPSNTSFRCSEAVGDGRAGDEGYGTAGYGNDDDDDDDDDDDEEDAGYGDSELFLE